MGEVLRWIGQFLRGIAAKTTLNFDVGAPVNAYSGSWFRKAPTRDVHFSNRLTEVCFSVMTSRS